MKQPQRTPSTRRNAPSRTLSSALEAPGLTNSERLVLVVLAHEARDGRRVMATMPALAKAAGLSESSARRCVGRLRAMGHIHREDGKLSRYSVTLPAGTPYDWAQMTGALQADLKPTHKLVLAYVAWRGGGGICAALQKTVAKALGLSESRVSRVIGELVAGGQLARVKAVVQGTVRRLLKVLVKGRGRVVRHRKWRPGDDVGRAPVPCHPRKSELAPVTPPSSRSTGEPSRPTDSLTTFVSPYDLPPGPGRQHELGEGNVQEQQRKTVEEIHSEILSGAPSEARVQRDARRQGFRRRPQEDAGPGLDAALDALRDPRPQGRAKPIAEWTRADLVAEFVAQMRDRYDRKVPDRDQRMLKAQIKTWLADGMTPTEIHDAIDHFANHRSARNATIPAQLFVRTIALHARKTATARTVRDEKLRAEAGQAQAAAKAAMTPEEREVAHTLEWLDRMSPDSRARVVKQMTPAQRERYGLVLEDDR